MSANYNDIDNEKTQVKPRETEPVIALPPGTRIHEYVISRVLGTGGFGITYQARDSNLDKDVAIKEYFPTHLAYRNSEMTINPRTAINQEFDEFQWGLQRVIDEARVLARCEHPNVVRVLRYFEANSTAYIVMEYVPGNELSALIKQNTYTEDRIKPILMSLLDGLELVHNAMVLHRDLKPKNIMIRPDNTPVLIDFGAARQAIGQRSLAVTAIMSAGYTPREQLSTQGNLGPWTDIYAMAATVYHALTGKPPVDSLDRIDNDPYVPATVAAKGKASDSFLKAVDWGLAVQVSERPQSVAEWREALSGGKRPEPTTRKVEPKESELQPTNGPRWLVQTFVASIVLLVVAAAGWTVFSLQRGTETQVSTPTGSTAKSQVASEKNAEPETSAPSIARPEPAVPSATPPAPAERKPTAAEESDFQAASYIDTAEAYQLYLRLHPDSFYSEQVENRLDTRRN